MNIDDNLINHLSNLAKLSFEGDNREALKKDLEKIIGFMNQLNTLDTTNVQPLVFMTDEVNRLRVDEAHLEISKNEALKNGPNHDSDYFRIPKVKGKHNN
ncbi:MAG: Asp-tRNA(Asn)/Glu-tRNA(Gln) amidotransferase subunit GatC [Flavobacteriales bacterium]|jgi:aspartyl-tRNA(Asn)/glutamyl-tRNA(Gln) amidotransferase subunit C